MTPQSCADIEPHPQLAFIGAPKILITMKMDDNPFHGGRRAPLLSTSSSSSTSSSATSPSSASPSLPFQALLDCKSNSGNHLLATNISKPRAFAMAGLLSLSLVLVLTYANMVFMVHNNDDHAALNRDAVFRRRQFEGEIDYKRIEKMIQIALDTETKKLVHEIGADIGAQILAATRDGLKETIASALPPVERQMGDKPKVEPQSAECSCPNVPKDIENERSKDTTPLFPRERVSDYVTAMARVPKDDFAKALSKQLGMPFEPSTSQQHDVFLLYDKTSSIPTNASSFYSSPEAARSGKVDVIPFIASAKEATENCEQINVVLTQPGNNRKQCVAIVPEYGSFYIHKLMRLATTKNGNIVPDLSVPFQYVSRFQRLGNPDPLYPIPKAEHRKEHWDLLKRYFAGVDSTLADIKAILSRIAINNTVVMMVSNYGHSDFLINFVCVARARNIDISNVIVFATDQETADLVKSLGVATYYDQGRFAEHSKESPATFGDKSFGMMLVAKIRYAQMVSMLGFNFLCQDVDVVWYKQPMQYFMATQGTDAFDFYFQEDGARTTRFEPYDANAGFYFVWNNERTRNFFNSLLMAVDATLITTDDQLVINVMLSEHAVRHGLKVKVFPRYEMEFPGGFNFHDDSPAGKDRMKKVLDQTGDAYVFHMSWTASSVDKDYYLQQMGMWHVQDQCVHKPADKLLAGVSTPAAVTAKCCSAKPLYSCHYRDKPSIGPCPDSPFKDKDTKISWW